MYRLTDTISPAIRLGISRTSYPPTNDKCLGYFGGTGKTEYLPCCVEGKLNMNSSFSSLIVLAFTCISLPAIAIDEYTKELYDSYCQACHVAKNGVAPKSFDVKAWDPRLKNGLASLVENAITGKGNMPAQGGCQECTYEDFEDLVKYMSSEKPAK